MERLLQIDTLSMLRFSPPKGILQRPKTAFAKAQERYHLSISNVAVAKLNAVNGIEYICLHAGAALCKRMQHADGLVLQAALANRREWYSGIGIEPDQLEQDFRKGTDWEDGAVVARFAVRQVSSEAESVWKRRCPVDVQMRLRGIVFRQGFICPIWSIESIKECSRDYKTLKEIRFNQLLMQDETPVADECSDGEDIVDEHDEDVKNAWESVKDLHNSVIGVLENEVTSMNFALEKLQTTKEDDIGATESAIEFLEDLQQRLYTKTTSLRSTSQ